MTKMSSMVQISKKALRAHFVEFSIGLVLIVVLAVVVPQTVRADMLTAPTYAGEKMTALKIAAMQNATKEYGTLPKSARVPMQRVYPNIPITSYNSEAGQTDATPCIAARGFDLCEHNTEDVIAANFLPMGTQVRIPELYGDRVFTVVDRMNARYYYRVDIWMKQKADSRAFGVKHATIEVL